MPFSYLSQSSQMSLRSVTIRSKVTYICIRHQFELRRTKFYGAFQYFPSNFVINIISRRTTAFGVSDWCIDAQINHLKIWIIGNSHTLSNDSVSLKRQPSVWNWILLLSSRKNATKWVKQHSASLLTPVYLDGISWLRPKILSGWVSMSFRSIQSHMHFTRQHFPFALQSLAFRMRCYCWFTVRQFRIKLLYQFKKKTQNWR